MAITKHGMKTKKNLDCFNCPKRQFRNDVYNKNKRRRIFSNYWSFHHEKTSRTITNITEQQFQGDVTAKNEAV
jgi:hypothetical protein